MALSWRPTTVQFKKDCRDYEWKEGEIAFLKDHTEFSFSDSDNLIKPGQLQRGATKHPVIILKRHSPNSTYVLVTPVSAYGSGPDNKFLPPWKQRRHQFRATDDFRAFSGSERPTNQRPDLFLEAGSMPKPRVSWVNVQNVYLVPIRTLKFFDKTEKVLCLQQALWLFYFAKTKYFDHVLISHFAKEHPNNNTTLLNFEDPGFKHTGSKHSDVKDLSSHTW
ncbi:hypothetical protein UCREL1_7449 [Eutypa lata UCREL1]|uniref:Uncharacterized protein n=1 Tax=Eutypa lata (strain UCR-EL1) TaxID=1287681 RepID=M7SMZ7_EUTLA|nr:hypothetical protein UCREL1_7449 [Eutypa lata UCREL1]